MPRIPRLFVKGEEMVYHIISRTALDGYVIDDRDKDYFVDLLRHLIRVYFVEVLGYSVMGNHFHLVILMKSGQGFMDEEIKKRFEIYYNSFEHNDVRMLSIAQIPFLREKWGNLSEYVKDIKQRFSRYYNEKYNRKGYFWSERFKSLIVEEGGYFNQLSCLC